VSPPNRARERASNSRSRAIKRLLRSWMLWYPQRRARKARELQSRQFLQLQRALELRFHQLLLAALTPLAEALLRQDKVHLEYHQALRHHLQAVQEIELEILRSQPLQVEAQIYQELGLSTPPLWSPN
jgi:hypothetical protein